MICIFWRFKNLTIIKRCNAERLNNLESSVIVVIFCDTASNDNIKYKMHHKLYEHGRPSGLSDRLLLQWSVVRANRSCLDSMFTLINKNHLMTSFNTCQNMCKGPFKKKTTTTKWGFGITYYGIPCFLYIFLKIKFCQIW